MRALVTGGNGFIGSFLIEKLLEKKYLVRCMIRKTSNLRWIENLPVEFVVGDLLREDTLRSVVKDVDLVIHLGGLTKARNEADYYKVNAEGTENLLKAIETSGTTIQKFVLISSLAAAGPGEPDQPISEERAPAPITPYGKSKAEAEKITLSHSEKIPVTILRPPPVYGPRDTDVFEMFKTVKMGIKPRVSGPPRFTSVIHVDDLAEGILLASEAAESSGQIYFLCEDEAYSWEAISDIIQQAFGNKAIKITVPAFLLDGIAGAAEMVARLSGKAAVINHYKVLEMKQLSWVCDNSRAKKELGFTPRILFREGAKSTADWYLREGWL